jgi:molybdopterin molybdotransferase
MSKRPLTPIDVARTALLADLVPTPIETVPLSKALGRTLAENLAALRTQPPFDAAAMDGWALRAADATTPGARLRVVGEAAAGRAAGVSVGPGEAVRIFTGAPMPAGADTIEIQENARRDGDHVVFDAVVRPHRHVRRAGSDFREGAVGLSAGRRLGFADLALAASLNHAELPVRRRPKVAVIATGDELVAPGSPLGPDQIVASNGYGVLALAEAAGAEAIDLGIVGDEAQAIAATLARGFAADPDVLVTIGGASVGDHDLTQAALKAAGVEIGFWKIAMRPGKPLMHGRRGRTRVIGLPGNPAAALVGSIVFLEPLIRTLLGSRSTVVDPERLPTAVDLPANDERADHLRARIVRDADGRAAVRPVDDQDSSFLSRFAAAEVLIVRPVHAPAAPAGTLVPVLSLARLGTSA